MRTPRLALVTAIGLMLGTVGVQADPTEKRMVRFVVRHPDPAGLTEQAADTVVCEYRALSTVELAADESTKRLQPRYEAALQGPMQVVYSEIRTDHPKMKGSMGEAPLVVVKRFADEVELAERTDAGNLVMHSLFLAEKTAIMTKQYRIVRPFGLIMMGKCW